MLFGILYMNFNSNRIWFLFVISFEKTLVNPRKTVCGVKHGKLKHLTNLIIFLGNIVYPIQFIQFHLIAIVNSQKRWSAVSSVFKRNKRRGEDDFPTMKSF